jgi:polysaccharide export outer membrane protein
MRLTFIVVPIIALTLDAVGLVAQQPAPASRTNAAPVIGTAKGLPAGYVIGPGDTLTISFWRDKELSGDVTVRPDGKISLPLINEVDAAGLTPEQLRARLIEAAGKYIEDPDPSIQVKEIRSRIVFITGQVTRPANYPLNSDMTVLQLIAVAGGLLEYAKDKDIVVIRNEGGKEEHHKFNYRDVVNRKNTAQNIVLKPGDTVVVP